MLPGKHAYTQPIVNQTGSNRIQSRRSQSKSKFITPDKCTTDSLKERLPDFSVIVLRPKSGQEELRDATLYFKAEEDGHFPDEACVTRSSGSKTSAASGLR